MKLLIRAHLDIVPKFLDDAVQVLAPTQVV